MDPTLSDGTALPTGIARQLLRLFDRRWGVHGGRVLDRSLLAFAAHRKLGSEADARRGAQELIVAGLIEQRVGEEPAISSPLPNIVIPRIRLGGEPEPGEVYYVASARGTRLARLQCQIEDGRGPHMLVDASVEDRVLWVVGSEQPHIDTEGTVLNCGSMDPDDVKAGLEALTAAAIVHRAGNGLLSLSHAGVLRFAPLDEEMKRLVAGLPPPGVDPRLARQSAFDIRGFHAVVAKAARQKFIDDHGSDAVREATAAFFEACRQRVRTADLQARTKKGNTDPDGEDLVGALQREPALIVFGDRSTATGLSVHQGAFDLLRGIGKFARNPAAHRAGFYESDVVTLEKLALVSLMMRAVEAAT